MGAKLEKNATGATRHETIEKALDKQSQNRNTKATYGPTTEQTYHGSHTTSSSPRRSTNLVFQPTNKQQQQQQQTEVTLPSTTTTQT